MCVCVCTCVCTFIFYKELELPRTKMSGKIRSQWEEAEPWVSRDLNPGASYRGYYSDSRCPVESRHASHCLIYVPALQGLKGSRMCYGRGDTNVSSYPWPTPFPVPCLARCADAEIQVCQDQWLLSSQWFSEVTCKWSSLRACESSSAYVTPPFFFLSNYNENP